MGDTQAYLVVANRSSGGSAQDLQAVLQDVAGDARIKVGKVSGEPPTTLCLEAPPALMQGLQQRFGDKIIIEPDSPLKLM